MTETAAASQGGTLVGVDVGGTFVDLVSIDRATGELELLKILSTPDSPDRAIIEALQRSSVDPGTVVRFVHGSTVSTNAILERKGARVGLLTTKGFEDVVEIGNIDRAHHYDLSWEKPKPLSPRYLRSGVDERIEFSGEELRPLDRDGVLHATELLIAEGAEAIAVCFLHAYANPEHERRARDLIVAAWPDVPVSISSEAMNAIREFERTSTVIVDAYIKPVTSRYLNRLQDSLRDIGLVTDLQVMQSSGGVMNAEATAEIPVHTLLSGPAGGAIAAQHLAIESGYRNMITLDIGGTSADVALINDGHPLLTTQTEIDWGIPVHVPMIDIRTIGAGGGSIAWIDNGGRLKVGPESAGASPGPACYGLGGEAATVTDANLILGYLTPDYYAGGAMPLHPDLAARAVRRHVAEPLGLDDATAARGIIDIMNANMRNLIRKVSVQQGYDPREFSLMAFGGGGPVHAAAVARELGIRNVLVPMTPGVLSAYGLVLAVPRHDFVQSFPRLLDDLEWSELMTIVAALEHRGKDHLQRAGVTGRTTVAASLDMQYERQNYTLNIELGEEITSVEDLRRVFYEAYQQKYGYHLDDQPVDIVNCRVSVAGPADETAAWSGRRTRDVLPADDPKARDVFFEEWGEFRSCPVLRRATLTDGQVLPSPSIIEQTDTSVVIPPTVQAEVITGGIIRIDISQQRDSS